MELSVLASGSKGNCYLLKSKNQILMLECGIAIRNIMKALDFNISIVVGCLITHEHKDHCKAVDKIIEKGIDIYTSNGTAQALNINSHRLNLIKSEDVFQVGEFKIIAFETQHDSKEPLGFLIQHEEMGNLLFITDSYYCQYTFNDLDHILVECNYSTEILNRSIELGKIPKSLRDRVVKSHFSITNVKEFLSSNNLSKSKEIVLLHLSDNNSDPKMFKESIAAATGKPTYIAETGLTLDLTI